MKERNSLWDELEAQKVLLEAQKGRVYQQLKRLVDAVVAGQITEWQEVMTLLIELIQFADHYAPAWELRADLALYIRQHFPEQVENSNAFTRILLFDNTPDNHLDNITDKNDSKGGETSDES